MYNPNDLLPSGYSGTWIYGPAGNLASYDLFLKLAKASPSTATAGDLIKLIARVKNIGTSKSPSKKVSYYLSPDKAFDPSDLLLGKATVRALKMNKGKKVVKTILVSASITPGKYYIIAQVNSGDSNTGNDTKASKKKITIY